jgi:hypothetical protein
MGIQQRMGVWARRVGRGVAGSAHRFVAYWKTVSKKVWVAWTMLGFSVAGWPISILMTDEPPVIMSLSWAALIWTSVDTIFTASIQKDKKDG